MVKNLFHKFVNLKNNRIVTMILPVIYLLIIVAVFGILTNGKFLQLSTFKIIINQSIIVATVATGAIFVYGTGNVNIAMGGTTGMIAAIIAVIYKKTEGLPLMIIVAFVIGIAASIIAVLISSKFKVKVIMITIVMMILFVSIQEAVLNYDVIYVRDAQKVLKGANFTYFAYIGFMALCIILFNFTKIGRGIKFIGSNPVCSRATGILNNRYLLVAFIISGIGAALGALMFVTRTGIVSCETAGTTNMDVMLAIVLGGMSIKGGSKSYIWSASVGAVTVIVLNAGFQILGVDSIVIQGIRGLFFLPLVVLSQTRTNYLPDNE